MKTLSICSSLLAAGALAFAADSQPQMTRFVPTVSDELLANPGMGWQTFHKFADEDRALQGLPSSSAYFRFYWREIESEEGKIDFAKLDSLFARARKNGQQLCLRIMCTGSSEYMDVPKWLKDKGCKGVEFKFEGKRHWVPDFTDPLFVKEHARMVAELGARYDKHPDFDLLDIGSVGLWGEWHMGGTEDVSTGKPVEIPLRARMRIIDEWCAAFPASPKAILIGSDEGMVRAAKEGLGWRADCLGDMGGFSKTWNHMDHFYLQQIEKTGAGEAWKQAPVAFESCWDMRKWAASGWNIRQIFDYALRCHASYVNNKSAPLPEGSRAEVERFLKRLGYRIVLRSAQYPAEVLPGVPFAITLSWENVGVAPPYGDYIVKCRAKAPTGAVAEGRGETIKGFVPGKRTEVVEIQIPATQNAGDHELAVAIVDPSSRKPAIRLAIEGRASDGWYPIGKARVSRGR